MKFNSRYAAVALIALGAAISGCSQQPVASAPEPQIPTMPAPSYTPPPMPEVSIPPAPAPVVRPKPAPAAPSTGHCWHGINAQGQCLPDPRAGHQQSMRPVAPMPAPVQQLPARPPVQHLPTRPLVPPVKAKGHYRGAVELDRSAVQRYQY